MAGIYRFINTDVPTKGCNLRCEYCYVRQWGHEDYLEINNEKQWYCYSIDHMIEALQIERMGGVCMFNLSAQGETLLSPFLFEIVTGLLNNGHYVAIISNCTITHEIEKYCNLSNSMKDRLFFKASFHYRELKKRGLLDVYSNNINLLKKNGISFSVELVSNDYILDEIEEVKKYSILKFGALPHVLGGREETTKGKYPRYNTKLSDEDFKRIWGSFESPLFDFQDTDYLTPHNDDFCYAGEYTGSLDLRTGDFSACPSNKKITNFFEDIEHPIQFLPVGNNCPFPFCFCGFFLQVLAGVCSDSYNVKYRFFEFRDRKCSDGTHWLTPSIKEVFSHTCSEYHNRVNEKQRYIINSILATAYNGYSAHIDNRMINIVKDFFENKTVGNVAIYGMSEVGKMFADLLKEAGLRVECGIDKNCMIECSIPVVSPFEIPKSINTVIVAAYSYPSIKKFLRENYSHISVCSVLDLIGDSL